MAPSRGTVPERAAVAIPVKGFEEAKGRLATFLGVAERAALARSMAETVVQAAGALPTWVVCDDEHVRQWANDLGVQVCWTPGLGLNGAVAAAYTQLSASHFDQIIVAHADLPHAEDLAWVADFAGVTLVPDRTDDGTNVLALPARTAFTFSYGPGSFSRHCAEAERLGLPTRIARDRRLAWDVDVPDDLSPADPFDSVESAPA